MNRNPEVTDYLAAIAEPWQAKLAGELHELVHATVPDAQERMQYKKPHFLKNGKYAAVMSLSKDAVSFTIFNAAGLTVPDKLFDGPPERKTIKLRKDQSVDSELLAPLLAQASATL
ncbi:DUF1801 domain-containing protein [Paenibacillus cymbidii]|uniref:DUF1801 domain-containing protein n=1 Tax=Paenibacillus cymbidii TaxID=1639034 RepID=UPI0010800AA5|nr:DUF1801 domain-containing protein [Paenibacillus cymbidii]